VQGVLTLLYDTVFRLNMRDGVWYESGVSGNTPLTWDSTNSKWVPVYDPDEWVDHGVDATLDPSLLPAARMVWMGAPGYFSLGPPDFGPAKPAASLSAINAAVTAGTLITNSTYAWPQGDYVVLGDASQAYFANEDPAWYKVGRAPVRIRFAINQTIQNAIFNTAANIYWQLNNRYIGVAWVDTYGDTSVDPVGTIIEPWAPNQYAVVRSQTGVPANDVSTQVYWNGSTWGPFIR
jgi:hypothetical protein